ncbi:hypothetical protein A2303_02540 [Candidatus Falkowbacteria bacterium RIFOXYB2_FULL_47_14]|uniref:histidine kinase n=1 Tax=Candidatus Falkowbacteria bacterium RIFOXYA2_FULL_47_19 TaxID=1797994 RepID=A0A1F5SJP9_9BACT|nr:MAG: hypothetical protein A2227_06330 [Candidatus Falkowbacteria bacterium RIFOXYA2_FULL_47_19]OGF35924.1 MAG: hypothetical protein A2468_01785 [Candidatus Falkowbacteria bacterium RIFOXYC2_FULL_46_15]OGF43938.1 MAG: hypothetical protein A2303_02540 [Candidatus Falkowbacteria bacterium RIFOXYB2_FULL_47_14]
MDAINIILTVVVVIYLLFAYLILLKGKNKTISRLYLVVILSVILWTVSMIVYRAASPENTLFWVKVLYFSATFTASSFFVFSRVFPRGNAPKKTDLVWAVLLNMAAIILVITPDIIIKGVEIIPGSEKCIIWGRGYFIYFLYIAGLFSAGLMNLFRKYLSEKGEYLGQLRYVFWGYFLGSFFAMTTNLLLVWWGDFRFNWLGQVMTVVMIGFTVYAIVVHRLMDMRLYLRSGSVYFASLISIIVPLIIIKYFSGRIGGAQAPWLDYIYLILAIALFSGIKKRYYALANKYFFSSLYDARALIASLSDKLSSTLIAGQLYEYIASTLSSAFHCEDVCFLILDKDRKEYMIGFRTGFDRLRPETLKIDAEAEQKLIGKKRTIFINYAAKADKAGLEEVVSQLRKMGVEIVVPLSVKEEMTGLILLGPKETRETYNNEDLSFLDIIGSQSAVAIDNALHYEEIKNFNVKLEKEVWRATWDLKRANDKLKQLDEAKSEFVSVASHQLRTPLTIIKGYISLMLEGNFGSFSASAKESLNNVYESNERLIHLVENLLNISRIESGRLKFNFEATRLEKLISGVLDELAGPAENKGLKLVFKAPKKVLPFVNVDREKIRQAIMNLVDNAVKYSEKGKITISVECKEKNIVTTVADQGLGMSRQDQVNLFDKFSRGNDVSLVHTEGTGLGLYVAKKMIKAHQGRIWAESDGEGKGSRFYFTLPVLKHKS